MSISNVTPTTTLSRSPVIIPNRGMQQILKTSPIIRKEPIQIVRGNGRVITLPPIEAPTTRAKRRAQTHPSSSLPSTASNSPSSGIVPLNVSETSLDNSIHSSSTVVSERSSLQVLQEKKNPDNSARRRISKGDASKVDTISNPKIKRSTAKKKLNKTPVDANTSDSGGEDDDDPNK